MGGRIIDARVELVLPAARAEALFRRGPVKEVAVPDLAAAIHKAFCEPRGFGDVAGEVHERMHREIATAIFDQLAGG